MSELYRYFSRDWEHVLDYSDQSLLDLYNQESYGGHIDSKNGFAVGKKWLNVYVASWRESIAEGTLFRHELYEDPELPSWWLDRVLKDTPDNWMPWWKDYKKAQNDLQHPS